MNLEEATALINSSIRALKAYHLEPEECAIKLNQNENPYDWPRQIKEEVARYCVERPWNRYPPFIPEQLKDDLAKYAGVEKGSVIVGNGSNEMLLVLLLSLVTRDSTVVFCEPTFTVYKLLVSGLAATPNTVPLTRELTYDIPAIIAAVERYPGSMLILCSPNNPTGSTIGENDLRSILREHKGFCVFDQAYVEFGGYDAIPLLKDHPNLIVTRTFSKAFAGAGLRLGYLVGNPDIVREINKIKLPYNLNFLIEYTAQTLLKNRDAIFSTHQTITVERDHLLTFLKTLPLDEVYPSAANFILIRYREKARLFDALKRSGILVRDVSSYPMLEGCLRISIGTPHENEALKKAFGSFFSAER
ncbi:MAG: histidinol-phosphate transaminase [Chitinispirillaceae bacterium]|nr:histidinol-phosphate transaminase [Chitinispirillaceae bacterium]